jgi:hypothetical protein
MKKLAEEMKMMLDCLVGMDVESPVVCGVWVNGKKSEITRMTVE